MAGSSSPTAQPLFLMIPLCFHTRYSNRRTSNSIRFIKFCTTRNHSCFKRRPKGQVFTKSDLELNPSMLTSIPGLIGLVFLMLLASTETNGGNNKQSRVEFNDTETTLQEVNNIQYFHNHIYNFPILNYCTK